MKAFANLCAVEVFFPELFLVSSVFEIRLLVEKITFTKNRKASFSLSKKKEKFQHMLEIIYTTVF